MRDWSAQIVGHLATWLAQNPERRRVATFAALPGEPDLRALHLRCPGREFIYPLVGRAGSLTFHLVKDPATLVAGHYGIGEPDPQRHPSVLLEEADLILCPGLAFAEDGARLGRGKGYYDRALDTAASKALRMGVGFAALMRHAQLPTEAHDGPMGLLVNESGLTQAGRTDCPPTL